MEETARQPQRGWLLLAWLGLMLIANISTVIQYLGIIDDFVRHSDPRFTGVLQWALPLLVVLGLVNVVAVFALWFWRKVGFYIFAVTSVIALIINLLLNVPILTALLGLGGLVILWLILRPRWQYFH